MKSTRQVKKHIFLSSDSRRGDLLNYHVSNTYHVRFITGTYKSRDLIQVYMNSFSLSQFVKTKLYIPFCLCPIVALVQLSSAYPASPGENNNTDRNHHAVRITLMLMDGEHKLPLRLQYHIKKNVIQVPKKFLRHSKSDGVSFFLPPQT